MSVTSPDRAAIDAERDKLNGGRQSIEDMADDDLDQPEQLQLIQIGGSKIDTAVGGGKPDESFVKIKSVSRPITGQFKRHETRTLLVTVRVTETHFVDKYDDDGRPVGGGKRRAVVTPVSIVPVSEEQAAAVLGQPED